MRKHTKAPMSYFGGKSKHLQYILPLIPPHKTYVEVFAGSLAVFFAKDPSPIEVVNDIDKYLVNFYRVLRHPVKAKELENKLKLTLYSRAEFEEKRELWNSDLKLDDLDEVDQAHAFYVLHEQSFGCYKKAFRYSRSHTKRGIAGAVSTWWLNVSIFPDFHYRIKNAQIECRDFKQILEVYDTPDTFFYIDPPYVLETRGSHRYDHDLETKDHVDLVNMLLNIQGKVLLSCYDDPVYYALTNKAWNKYDFETKATAMVPNRKIGQIGIGMLDDEKRVETLYYNYQI
mgnify:CR=1 FL=1